MASLTYAGVAIGDVATNVVTEVHRAGGVDIQTGLLRPDALVSDRSPNLYFTVRVLVHYKASSMIALNKWMAAMGELMRKGLATMQVSEGAETYVMEEAAMRGPFAVPDRGESNAALARNVEVAFISTKRPH